MNSKNAIIVLSVATALSLVLCIFLYTAAQSARAEARLLSERVGQLEKSSSALQLENDGLWELLSAKSSIEARAKEQEAAEPIDAAFEDNPIDRYFLETAQKIVPITTYDMMEYGFLECSAWEAEMFNCYEILKGKTGDERVRECIDNEKNSFIEYVKNSAETQIYCEASDAFLGGKDVLTGTISHVLRPGIYSEAYKQKTKELFERLSGLGETPRFIFSEEEYDGRMRQTFPQLWEKTYDTISAQ